MSIPNKMHVVWTGPQMPSQSHLQKIANLSARGVTREEAKAGKGLNINLWVDDIGNFKSCYEKGRCFNHPIAGDLAALPTNPSINLKSISELETHSKVQKILWHFLNTDRTPGRNKGVSASDIARAMILHQEGGVYSDLRPALSTTGKFSPVPQTSDKFMCPLNTCFHTWYAIAQGKSPETSIMIDELAYRLLASTAIPEHTKGAMSANTYVSIQKLKSRYNTLNLPHPLEVAINKRNSFNVLQRKLSSWLCVRPDDSSKPIAKPNSRYDHERHPKVHAATYAYINPYGEYIENKTNQVYIIERTGHVFNSMKQHQNADLAVSCGDDAARAILKVFNGTPKNKCYANWAKNRPAQRSTDSVEIPDWQWEKAGII